MAVADTSRSHYKSMVESGELTGQMKTVFETLDDLSDPVTLNELHKMFLPDIPKSTISGRLNDLKDKGLVIDLDGDGKREDKISGITCKTWSTTEKFGSDVREWVTASHTFENDGDDLDDLIQPIENNNEGGDSSVVDDEQSVNGSHGSHQPPYDTTNDSSMQCEETTEPPKPKQLTSKNKDELEAGDLIWG